MSRRIYRLNLTQINNVNYWILANRDQLSVVLKNSGGHITNLVNHINFNTFTFNPLVLSIFRTFTPYCVFIYRAKNKQKRTIIYLINVC
jgi:hypothetical protein